MRMPRQETKAYDECMDLARQPDLDGDTLYCATRSVCARYGLDNITARMYDEIIKWRNRQ